MLEKMNEARYYEDMDRYFTEHTGEMVEFDEVDGDPLGPEFFENIA